MAKYNRSKKRIIEYMHTNGIESMTSQEMLEFLSVTKSGKPSSMTPAMNRFCQSLARDSRFIKLGYGGKSERFDMGMGGTYDVMLWGVQSWA